MIACPCGSTLARPVAGERADCEDCAHYLCPRCERWIAWADGSADDADPLCDGCALACGVPEMMPVEEMRP